MIWNIHLGVGELVLCQMEGVGLVFSDYHILKCFRALPRSAPLWFLKSILLF